MSLVYSTNPDFKPAMEEEEAVVTPLPARQKLQVYIDRRNRGGKQVTLVKGFVGNTDDLSALAKTLKNRCGTGGSAKDGEILIQGDYRDRVVSLLSEMGYGVRRGN